jgi:hypothetical protein
VVRIHMGEVRRVRADGGPPGVASPARRERRPKTTSSSLDRWNAAARDATDATWQLTVYALCATAS